MVRVGLSKTDRCALRVSHSHRPSSESLTETTRYTVHSERETFMYVLNYYYYYCGIKPTNESALLDNIIETAIWHLS